MDQAAELLRAVVEILWTGGRFASRVVAGGAPHTGESLLLARAAETRGR